MLTLIFSVSILIHAWSPVCHATDFDALIQTIKNADAPDDDRLRALATIVDDHPNAVARPLLNPLLTDASPQTCASTARLGHS